MTARALCPRCGSDDWLLRGPTDLPGGDTEWCQDRWHHVTYPRVACRRGIRRWWRR